MKLTYEDKVLIYELRKEEMIDKILHEYCSQDRVSLEYSLPNQGMLPNWLAQYKKKLEEMTELERLQAENAVLKNERTPIEGRKRAKRKTEIVRGLVTEFTLEILLKIIKLATSHLKGLKIGIMGCIVNGPGEMADADYGYVGAGRGKISLYKKKECIEKNIPEEEAVEKLIELIKANGDYTEKNL